MITEDYVSFETAKLLKEKGFNERCSHIYRNDGMHLYCGDAKLTALTNTEIDEPQDWVSETFACACPTLQMAMKWLKETYGIYPDIAVEEIDDNTIFFRVDGIYLKQKKMWDKYNNLFKTYEEACEAAIKYCLENLV